jgi:putative colanic acid biosynthesis acetyltransferase WcaF
MSCESITRSVKSPFGIKNQLARILWSGAWFMLFKLSPRGFHNWRCLILKIFGAKLGRGCHIYANAKIWAPWNLRCGNVVAIADGAEIYNPALITLEDYSIVSQGAYLCGASHNYKSHSFELISAPITIRTQGWVAARAIILMGVTVHEGAIVAAGSVVSRDVPAWTIYAGNPAKFIKKYERN